MKTISVPQQSVDINSLLEQAREEDILVRAADGTEFMVCVVDDFEHELVRTRKNAELMTLLDERARQGQTISLAEVKRQLGLRA